jgi:autotransporter-associated beta strand protein
MTSWFLRASIALAVVSAWPFAPRELPAAGIIDFGPVDEFTISQPTVQIQVGRFNSWLNEYLLDTGASGILAGKDASSELVSLGLQTDATYVDFGVAGPESTRVSKPYDFSFAGTDGVPITLPAVRMQTSGGNFGFYGGIAGMPLMAGRTVALNLAGQADLGILQIGVAFGGGTSAWPAPAAHQYTVPLTTRLFPPSGQQNPSDPLPVNAPLPFAPVEVQYGSTRQLGSFLLDTGAQQCILSPATAFSLGLDVNGNGSLDDEAFTFQTVAGVGGTVDIPVLRIDSLAIKAASGVDLLFRDVPVGIVDIDAAVPGVLGMNVLNSGWDEYGLNVFLGINPPGPPGAFGGVDLDFRSAASGTSQMRMSVTASRDTFISQGPVSFSIATGSQTQAQAGHTAIGGTGTITKTGAGTVILDAVNTVTGTTFVQGGTLRIATPNALFGSPTVVQPGGRLELTGTIPARLPAVTLAGGTLAAGVIAVNGLSGITRLSIDDGQLIGSPAVSVGVAGRLVLSGAAPVGITVSALSIDASAGGLLDLGRGRVMVAAGGMTRAALLADLAAGRASGDWAGQAGLTSSVAAADLARGVLRTVGWIEGGDGSLLVGYAAAGDSNVDGVVDILDAAGFLAGGRFDNWSAAVWSEGDFNYDGIVDMLDVADFVSVNLFDRGPYVGTGAAAPGVAAVPEPASLGWLAVAGAAVILSRRRLRSGCRRADATGT